MKLHSVIVPCRNELEHIDAFLDELAEQEMPPGWAVEWLIADGDSSDGTRERLAERARLDSRLVVIHNPRRIVSTGLNACIARAGGDVIARLDVHTNYAKDYLTRCLAVLDRTGADNVGGPWVAVGNGTKQAAIAAAFQCRWVVGGARSRDQSFEGWTDTVYLGCWPRSTFDRFGAFDENLVRNQDDEHNLRIRRAGGRIWQSSAIRSTYHPRAALAQLFAQQRQYGYWRPFVVRKHGIPASWRQLAPAALIAAGAISFAALPLSGAWPVAFLLGFYLVYLATVSFLVAASRGWRLLVRLPAVVAAYHVGYGLGTWQGLFAQASTRPPSAAHTDLTR
jgi:glycosyltransferase involved in cell wall biosynthesis